MKKLPSAIFHLFVAVALLATSCQKDPVPGAGNGNPPNAVLKKIEQDANNYAAVEYNSEGLLSKFTLVNDALTTQSSFTYSADKKPSQGAVEGFKLNFKYAAGALDKVEYVASNSTGNRVESYAKFSYQNNRLNQTIVYNEAGNSYLPDLKILYEYYANGDVKSMSYWYLSALPDQFTLVDKTVYEYNSNINPLKAPGEVFYTLYINHSTHNITKETVYDKNNQVTETRSYSFNYNSAGLPLTCVENIVYPNSPGISKNIKYIYQ